MTWQTQAFYLDRQLQHFDILIERVIEENVDVLIIAGNLFGQPNPKNTTLDRVLNSCYRLDSKGVKVFILPGANDTPLLFSKDCSIHRVLENLPNVEILQYREENLRAPHQITTPVFKGEINDENLQFFSFPSPFQKPDEFLLDLEIKDDDTNCFIVSDLFSFSNVDTSQLVNNLLEELQKQSIDLLLIGGYFPYSVTDSKYSFRIIHCPQIHPSDLDFIDQNHGIRIQEISAASMGESPSYKILPISSLILVKEVIDASQISINHINDSIEETIKTYSDINSLLRIELIGELNKDQYHAIKIFHHIERGKLFNFYFEFLDQVEFLSEAPDIEGLSVIHELENVAASMAEKLNLETTQQDEYQPDLQSFHNALRLIKDDWDNLGGSA